MFSIRNLFHSSAFLAIERINIRECSRVDDPARKKTAMKACFQVVILLSLQQKYENIIKK